MDLSITSEQKINVRLNPKTAAGNPAAIDGAAQFTVESGNASVVVDPDGLGATLISPDFADVSVIRVEADADLGEGVVPISDLINLSVSSPLAASLGLSAGTPENK